MPSDLTSSTGSGSHLPTRERRSQFGYESEVPIADRVTRRPKAAVSSRHMLRWPFAFRSDRRQPLGEPRSFAMPQTRGQAKPSG